MQISGAVSPVDCPESCFTCQGFPQSGWSDRVAHLPSVHVGVILDYLQHRQLSTESKGGEPHLNTTVGITQKPLNRGYQFFYWSYVHNMRVVAPPPAPGCPSQYYVKAECWASQKKASKYSQKLLLTGTVEEYGVKVEHAHCTCPAGIAGGCQHVVACLFTMEKCKQTNTTTSLPPPESCTSLQRAWGPRQRSISPQALQQVVVERAKMPRSDVDSAECTTTKRKKSATITSSLYEARAGTALTTDYKSVVQLRDQLQALEATNKCGFVQLLSPSTREEHPSVTSKFGFVPFGSCLSYQQPLEGQHPCIPTSALSGTKASASTTGIVQEASPTEVPQEVGLGQHQQQTPNGLEETHCVCPSTFLQLPLFSNRPPSSVQATAPAFQPKAVAIERLTRNQSNSSSWYIHRCNRITASKFHDVVRRKKAIDVAFVKHIFEEETQLPGVTALDHGQQSEPAATEDYMSAMQRLGHSGLEVFRVGLCLHPDHEYIAASPDRLVYDPASDPHIHGLLEVKCPLTLYQQDLTPREACEQIESFCCQVTSGEVRLKRSHRYYTQVQGQLGVTGLTWCDFVIWAGPGRMSIERIDFDPVFWEETVLMPLIHFFTVHGPHSKQAAD